MVDIPEKPPITAAAPPLTPAQAKGLRRPDRAELKDILAKHELYRSARMGGARANLKHLDLSGVDFTGRDLSHADFTGSYLAEAIFTGNKLDYALFYTADLRRALFEYASLVRADFRGANLRDARMMGADLSGADFREGAMTVMTKKGELQKVGSTDFGGADLRGVNFTDAKLIGVSASQADFTNAMFRNCDMTRINLRGAKLINTNLDHTDLTMADMRGSDMAGAIFTSVKTPMAEMQDANMENVLTDKPQGPTEVDLTEPLEDLLLKHTEWVASGGATGTRLDLSGFDLRTVSNLKRACLTMFKAERATFVTLDLTGGQLQAAELNGADLRAANFTDIDARGLHARGARLDGLNAYKARFAPVPVAGGITIKGDLSKASLRYANFHSADLTEMDFTDADLTHADFTSAKLEGVIWTRAKLSNAIFDEHAPPELHARTRIHTDG